MNSDDFKKKVMEWSEKIGVKPKEIHIRPMKQKIASCSSRGRLSFSTDLLKQDVNKQDHVIVHELLHLKYPNHGKMFSLLEKIYLKNIKHSCSSGSKNVKLQRN